jgi:hypothetical protein
MNLALVAFGVPTLLLYGLSLVLVMWTVVDVARRPVTQLPAGRKAVVGWLFFGIVGAFVALVYLVGPRRQMNAGRW